MNTIQAYERWREMATADADVARELAQMHGDAAAIQERFATALSFGTGGLRGLLGAGTARMNVYTVGQATQGYANYLRAQGGTPAVAIAHDSRNKSRLFAETAAAILAANGVRAHLFPILMPTPALSFAVRHLGCAGGIVITASHNPAPYNGYKVYGPDGCQITDGAARDIQQAIAAVDLFDGVQTMPFADALARGDAALIGEGVRRAYLDAVSAQSLLPKITPRDIPIVYTPLHGAGIACVPDCLAENGFSHVRVPYRQALPDGDFPTCPSPNPEEDGALAVGLAFARETGARLLLATDPDCDRVGAAVLHEGEYVRLSGNQLGVLLLDFVCRRRRAAGTMPEAPVVVSTVVSTPMADKIAARYGVQVERTLTGFKYIGERIGRLEAAGEADRFLLGFEESYGYLTGSYVRDKDAVLASLLLCEMAAEYAACQMTLVDGLAQLYTLAQDVYDEALVSFAFPGAQGFADMQALMADLRAHPPAEIGGLAVVATDDYAASQTRFPDGRAPEPIALPVSDVLCLRLAGGSSVTVRPSGTEPKLKAYFMTRGASRQDNAARIDAMRRYIDGRVLPPTQA